MNFKNLQKLQFTNRLSRQVSNSLASTNTTPALQNFIQNCEVVPQLSNICRSKSLSPICYHRDSAAIITRSLSPVLSQSRQIQLQEQLGNENFETIINSCRKFAAATHKQQRSRSGSPGQFRNFSTISYKTPKRFKKTHQYSTFQDKLRTLFGLNKKKKSKKEVTGMKCNLVEDETCPGKMKIECRQMVPAKQGRRTPMKEESPCSKRKKLTKPCAGGCEKEELKCEQKQERAEVVCPNPPTGDEQACSPYYYKKVCIKTEKGKCVKYEMQRATATLPDRSSAEGSAKKFGSDDCCKTKDSSNLVQQIKFEAGQRELASMSRAKLKNRLPKIKYEEIKKIFDPCTGQELESSEAPPCEAEATSCQMTPSPCPAKPNPCAAKADPCPAKVDPCGAKEEPEFEFVDMRPPENIPRPICEEAPKCETTPKPKCEIAPKPKCEPPLVPKCESAPKLKCETVPKLKCEAAPMPKCEIAPKPKCEPPPVSKCEPAPPKPKCEPAKCESKKEDPWEAVQNEKCKARAAGENKDKPTCKTTSESKVDCKPKTKCEPPKTESASEIKCAPPKMECKPPGGSYGGGCSSGGQSACSGGSSGKPPNHPEPILFTPPKEDPWIKVRLDKCRSLAGTEGQENKKEVDPWPVFFDKKFMPCEEPKDKKKPSGVMKAKSAAKPSGGMQASGCGNKNPCGGNKEESPCGNKKGPCDKKQESPCDQKKEDPCGGKKSPCDKKDNPCEKRKRKPSPCGPKSPCDMKEATACEMEEPNKCEKMEAGGCGKKDPCGKKEEPCPKKPTCGKKESPCGKKKESPCGQKKKKESPCGKKKCTSRLQTGQKPKCMRPESMACPKPCPQQEICKPEPKPVPKFKFICPSKEPEKKSSPCDANKNEEKSNLCGKKQSPCDQKKGFATFTVLKKEPLLGEGRKEAEASETLESLVKKIEDSLAARGKRDSGIDAHVVFAKGDSPTDKKPPPPKKEEDKKKDPCEPPKDPCSMEANCKKPKMPPPEPPRCKPPACEKKRSEPCASPPPCGPCKPSPDDGKPACLCKRPRPDCDAKPSTCTRACANPCKSCPPPIRSEDCAVCRKFDVIPDPKPMPKPIKCVQEKCGRKKCPPPMEPPNCCKQLQKRPDPCPSCPKPEPSCKPPCCQDKEPPPRPPPRKGPCTGSTCKQGSCSSCPKKKTCLDDDGPLVPKMKTRESPKIQPEFNDTIQSVTASCRVVKAAVPEKDPVRAHTEWRAVPIKGEPKLTFNSVSECSRKPADCKNRRPAAPPARKCVSSPRLDSELPKISEAESAVGGLKGIFKVVCKAVCPNAKKASKPPEIGAGFTRVPEDNRACEEVEDKRGRQDFDLCSHKKKGAKKTTSKCGLTNCGKK